MAYQLGTFVSSSLGLSPCFTKSDWRYCDRAWEGEGTLGKVENWGGRDAVQPPAISKCHMFLGPLAHGLFHVQP
jgi:hypothetical protein